MITNMMSSQLGTDVFEPRKLTVEDAKALKYGHDL
jgi:hypothetical protein